jgi:hypothetical protein
VRRHAIGPRCGQDLNTHILITYADLIAQRRAEGGWLDTST